MPLFIIESDLHCTLTDRYPIRLIDLLWAEARNRIHRRALSLLSAFAIVLNVFELYIFYASFFNVTKMLMRLLKAYIFFSANIHCEFFNLNNNFKIIWCKLITSVIGDNNMFGLNSANILAIWFMPYCTWSPCSVFTCTNINLGMCKHKFSILFSKATCTIWAVRALSRWGRLQH